MANAGHPSSQQFGDLTLSDGSSGFQGVVNGDLTVNQIRSNAAGTTFNSANKQNADSCLEGTRIELLSQIRAWADGDEERCIYWLKGMAGTGKSTIALTIAREYSRNRRLGASFFFERGGGDIGSAKGFAATISSQLGGISEVLKKSISKAAASSHSHIDGYEEQWEKLVIQPLSELPSNQFKSPFLIVVDALDECGDGDTVEKLIEMIRKLTSLPNIHIRVFITSRPDPPLIRGFGKIHSQKYSQFKLDDIQTSVINEDIASYYQYQLSKLGLSQHNTVRGVISTLVERSQGLFEHAATVCRYVGQGNIAARESRLLSIVENTASSANAEEALDLIYSTVLEQSFGVACSAEDCADLELENSDLGRRFRRIVGPIATLFEAMTVSDLAMMISAPEEEIRFIIGCIPSVLEVPPPHQTEKAIRLIHPSFRDFLLSPKRNSHKVFALNLQDYHKDLFHSCVQLMRNNLQRKDLCNVKHPGKRAKDVSKAEVTKGIPSRVQYACLYWFLHLKETDIDLRRNRQIRDLFRHRFLFWLEALSWIGRLRDALDAIDVLDSVMRKTEKTGIGAFFEKAKTSLAELGGITDSSIESILFDTKQFLFSHGLAIAQAPLQAYSSALIFSPGNSFTRNQYIHLLPEWISTTPIVSQDWDFSLRTFETRQEPKRIVFSPCGGFIAILFRDGGLSLYDTLGMNLWNTNSPVDDLAFSPAKLLLVTASKGDGTARFWDAKTGIETQAPHRISDACTSLTYVVPTFSPDAHAIIATGTPEKVHVWYESTGKLQVLACSQSVNAVFSFDTRVLAVISETSSTQMIRLWNLPRNEELWDCCYSSSLMSLSDEIAIAFSLDGRTLAAMNGSMRVRLYDAATGDILRDIDVPDKSYWSLYGDESFVSSISFSSDGELLFAAWENGTVGMWNARNGSRKWLHRGHNGDGNTISLSPDGRFMAISMADNSVKLCNMSAIRAQQSFEWFPVAKQHPTITFSPNRETMLMDFRDENEITVWNTQTDSEQRLESGYHSSLGLSPSEKIIATVSSPRSTPRVRESTACYRVYIQFFEARNCTKIAEFQYEHRGKPIGVALSHKDDLVAIMTNSGGVGIIERTTGRVSQHFQLETYLQTLPGVMSFSPDDKEISILCNNTVEIWDICGPTRRLTLEKDSRALHALAFSLDGKRIATASVEDITIWHSDSGHIDRVIPVLRIPKHISFSTKGTELLTDHGDYDISVASRQSPRGISISNAWITEDGEDLIFVPLEYRSQILCIVGQDVRFTSGEGQTSSLRFTMSSKIMV